MYVAVSVFEPTVVNVTEHVPAATAAVQEFVPSLTVTLPVGAVGVLPKAPVTPKLTATGSPVTEVAAERPAAFVIVVVVLAWLTVRLRTLELVGAVLSLSTFAEMTAVPADVAWKLPVAVPAAWTVPCVLESVPCVAAQVTERPTISDSVRSGHRRAGRVRQEAGREDRGLVRDDWRSLAVSWSGTRA